MSKEMEEFLTAKFGGCHLLLPGWDLSDDEELAEAAEWFDEFFESFEDWLLPNLAIEHTVYSAPEPVTILKPFSGDRGVWDEFAYFVNEGGAP